MAFDVKRFTTFMGGQQGGVIMGMYDGTGAAGDPGGDALADIKNDDYAKDDAVKDAVRQASAGKTTGNGLPMILRGNDGLEMAVWYLDGTEVKTRAAAWIIT